MAGEPRARRPAPIRLAPVAALLWLSAAAPASAAFLALTLGLASPAEAGLVSGVQKILGGILQLPLSTLVGTFTGPPVLGTVLGAANGLVSGTGLVVSGAFEVAGAGISLAKMVAPYVLPFVF